MLHPEYGQATSFVPFAQFQHPLLEVLLVLSPKGELNVLLLTQKEADYWRGKIQEKRGAGPTCIALYDIALSSIVSSNIERPFPEEIVKGKPFQEILVQLKFFRGDAAYRKELYPALERWIQANGVSQIRPAFFSLTKDPKQFFGSDLELFCKKQDTLLT